MPNLRQNGRQIQNNVKKKIKMCRNCVVFSEYNKRFIFDADVRKRG